VAWDTDFIGREALERRRNEGVKSRIVTILLDDARAVPLGNEPVYADGRIVGKTTSAAFGYRVERPVALAEVDATIGEDTAVEVDIARQMSPGRVTLKPAFDPAGARMRKPKGA
jgi:4-methylaminobutanoate oxidase (formaldehyde-forming)